jgi:DnaJ-class molecular chaperone
MGQGMIEREETIAVRIPPGVPSGTVLETPLSQVGITNFYLRVHIHTTD